MLQVPWRVLHTLYTIQCIAYKGCQAYSHAYAWKMYQIAKFGFQSLNGAQVVLHLTDNLVVVVSCSQSSLLSWSPSSRPSNLLSRVGTAGYSPHSCVTDNRSQTSIAIIWLHGHDANYHYFGVIA